MLGSAEGLILVSHYLLFGDSLQQWLVKTPRRQVFRLHRGWLLPDWWDVKDRRMTDAVGKGAPYVTRDETFVEG